MGTLEAYRSDEELAAVAECDKIIEVFADVPCSAPARMAGTIKKVIEACWENELPLDAINASNIDDARDRLAQYLLIKICEAMKPMNEKGVDDDARQ